MKTIEYHYNPYIYSKMLSNVIIFIKIKFKIKLLHFLILLSKLKIKIFHVLN